MISRLDVLISYRSDMRVSLEWIKDFVDITAPAEEVAHRLTMAGLEIEGMETS